MSREPLSIVRDDLSEVIDRVEHHHERLTIARNGHDAAVGERGAPRRDSM
jgi:antitoxin YefM